MIRRTVLRMQIMRRTVLLNTNPTVLLPLLLPLLPPKSPCRLRTHRGQVSHSIFPPIHRPPPWRTCCRIQSRPPSDAMHPCSLTHEVGGLGILIKTPKPSTSHAPPLPPHTHQPTLCSWHAILNRSHYCSLSQLFSLKPATAPASS